MRRARLLCQSGAVFKLIVLAFGHLSLGSTLQDAQSLQQWLVNIRRDLHQIPELGYEEQKTSKYIRGKLDELGIKYQHPIAETGIVARLGQGKPVIGLRADIDALPIQEEVDVPFKSQHPGRMHACGHDAHAAMLLGAARLLKERELELKGTVVLLFQPAEEGRAGALKVLGSGALEGVDKFHGIHIWPDLDSGVIASKDGTIMAGTTSFEAEVKGVGGHGGMPHSTKDPVIATAAIVNALQPLVARETDPADSAVISVTKLVTGDKNAAINVLPDSVLLGASVRAATEKGLLQIMKRIDAVLKHTAEAHQCTATAQWREPYYLPTVNSAETTAVVEQLAKNLVGAEKWKRLEAGSMAGEDFSYIAREMPATFTFLGIRSEKLGSVHGLHTSRLFLDESVLPIGAALHTEFALHYLGANTTSQHTEL